MEFSRAALARPKKLTRDSLGSQRQPRFDY
jgi:hypothetical protein